jgi:hypothetical protein
MRVSLRHGLIFVGIFAQGAILWMLLGGWWLVAGAALAMLLPWWSRAEVPLLGCSLGGLGMLIGSWADVRIGAGLPACHLSRTADLGVAPWATFMFWGMLLGCLPVCLWSRCRHAPRLLWWSHAGMLIGMFAGGRILGGFLAERLGAAFAGAHAGMLIGMACGTAAGLWLGHAVRRRPRAGSAHPLEQPLVDGPHPNHGVIAS